VQRMRRSKLLLVPLLTLAIVAAACGGDDDNTSSATTQQEEEVVKGGTLVIGAEQEPDCADWIGACSGASWGTFTMAYHTIPRAFDTKDDSEYLPSPLLAGEPQLEAGPPQKVTYKINPAAVWSDKTPITSSDFKYTWEQITTSDDIYDTTGYVEIESVDDSDPKTAVVTFKRPYAPWKDLFGGFFGVLPKHLLEGKDRNAEMKDGYKWSGGAWLIEAWDKGSEVRLVPNPAFWGKKPNLDKVVFRFLPDTAAESSAYKTGQVKMIYPQAQIELAELKNAPNTKFDVVTSLAYEALWFNSQKPPLDSKAVRQAIAYGIDRDAIVKQLFQPVQEDIKPIDGFVTPANKGYSFSPFSKYKRDLDKVNDLMTGDGWTKGSDGIWAKGGQKAQLEIATTAGNKRRETTQEILQSQLKEAGFTVTTNNTRAAVLFGEWGPQGVFQSAIFAQVPTPDPGLCPVFCTKNIPSAANGNVGQNWFRLDDKSLDVWDEVDQALDDNDRKPLAEKGQEALAEAVPAIPIDPFPDVIIYNTAVIHGDVDHNTTYGPFDNMNEWWCTGGKCD
jgi:peptide/nickel transport system substrate-binding protein